MKLFATTAILVVAALAALVPVAPAALPSNSQGLTPRERYELNQRYPQTHGLAPSPEALAARAPDLVERYVTSHPSGSSVPTGRYVATHGLAPSQEAMAARTYTKTYGLAPSAGGAGGPDDDDVGRRHRLGRLHGDRRRRPVPGGAARDGRDGGPEALARPLRERLRTAAAGGDDGRAGRRASSLAFKPRRPRRGAGGRPRLPLTRL